MRILRILFIFLGFVLSTAAAGAQPLVGASKMWIKSAGKNTAQSVQKAAAAPRTPVEVARQVVARQKQIYADKKLLNKSIDKSLEGFGLDKAVYRSLAKRNAHRIAVSKTMLRRQIETYNKNRAQIKAQLAITSAVHQINYAKLLDANAQLIFLGEVHYRPSIRQEVYSAIEQYRKAHPHKKVYLLTEFMEAEYPNERPMGFYRNLYLRGKTVVPEQLPLLQKLAKQGVRVRGLEPLRGLEFLAKEFGVADKTFMQGSVSLVGQEIRNHAWAEKIRQYVQQDPNAVFFVYTGWSHSSYKYLDNVPMMLKDIPSQVVQFNLWWKDTLTPAFEDLFMSDFLLDPAAKTVAVLKAPRYRRLLGADVLINLHE